MEKIKALFSKIKGNKTHSSNIKLSLKEKINLLDQLSSLLNSGIPLTNALKIIMYQTKIKRIKMLVGEIIKATNKGSSLKESFSDYPKIFTSFDLSIIEMGEVTGKLGNSIEIIKTNEEKNKELRGKIIGALIYPSVIVTLSIGMIGVFMVYVIPKIQKMYKDAKVNLPDLTQTVIDISEFLQIYIFEIIIGIIVFIISVIIFKKHPKTRIYFDYFVIKIPLFGTLIRKKILSLFSSSVGTLLSSGVIINKSLEITSGALDNKYYEKELKKIISGVSKGVELSTLMGINEIQSGKEHPLFPIELASVVKIGEQTGRMPELLTRISKKFNKEIDETVKNIGTAIEPMVIIGVGAIIGTIIMAIMLPFFNMVNVI